MERQTAPSRRPLETYEFEVTETRTRRTVVRISAENVNHAARFAHELTSGDAFDVMRKVQQRAAQEPTVSVSFKHSRPRNVTRDGAQAQLGF